MDILGSQIRSSRNSVRPEDTVQGLFDSPAGKGKLGSKSAHSANLMRGFDSWCARDQVRDDMARGGKGMLVGLLGALIARGGGTDVSLSTEIADLGGSHLYCPIQDLIHEFEGEDPSQHLWHVSAPGCYVLTA